MAYKDPLQQRLASKRHYLANKDKYLERNDEYRLAIRKFVRGIKESSPCADCGQNYPYYVMDFDHLDSNLKLNDINYLTSTGRIGALKEELVKCEVVCANCHRIRTHTRTRSSAD
jgi:hypothetical protein